MAGKPFNCGIGPAMDVIGGKWKAMILWELHEQPRRFGELRRLVQGVSEKMLTADLRELEAAGLVDRHVVQAVPAHVSYSVTAWGRSLNAALAPLADWGEGYEQMRLRPPAPESGTP